MGSGRWMGNGGFGITQVIGNRNHARAVNHVPSGRLTTFDLKANNRTEVVFAQMLTLCQRIIWVVRQTWKMHFFDLGMIHQKFRDLVGIATMRIHTQF